MWPGASLHCNVCCNVQGNRELIDSMAGGSAKVLTQVLKLIDNHDLYGSVAYPKRHTQKDISDIYRLSLATHGVFTNVALQEPFGLTVIEVPALLAVLLFVCSSCFLAILVAPALSASLPPSLYFLACSSLFLHPLCSFCMCVCQIHPVYLWKLLVSGLKMPRAARQS